MTTPKADLSLAEAAAAFERELANYEKLSLELARSPVRSEKTLSRARKVLNDAGDSEAELGRKLEDLSKAMVHARDRQQACMARIQEAMQGAQARADEFTALLERVAALGNKARDVNEPVARVLAARSSGEDPATLLASLSEVDSRMQDVVSDAETIFEDANKGDWPEVAKDVKSLQQQVQSVRNKVKQACVELGPTITVVDSTSN
jgi:polyhydroxyalkanoate synthesis regulator phasin